MKKTAVETGGRSDVACSAIVRRLLWSCEFHTHHWAAFYSRKLIKLRLQISYLGIKLLYLGRMGLLQIEKLCFQVKMLRFRLIQRRQKNLLVRLYFLDKSRCLSVLRSLAEDGKKCRNLLGGRGNCCWVDHSAEASSNDPSSGAALRAAAPGEGEGGGK